MGKITSHPAWVRELKLDMDSRKLYYRDVAPRVGA